MLDGGLAVHRPVGHAKERGRRLHKARAAAAVFQRERAQVAQHRPAQYQQRVALAQLHLHHGAGHVVQGVERAARDVRVHDQRAVLHAHRRKRPAHSLPEQVVHLFRGHQQHPAG